MKILIYGYGNPGRQDDGLGILFVERLQKWAEKGCPEGIKITFDSNYQLNAEDAFAASENDIVIFIDSSKANIKNINFKKIKPCNIITFSTHSMGPESVLGLCKELYGKLPEAHLLAIKGYRWEPGKKITKKAAQNLEKAVKFIQQYLKNLI